MVSGLTPSVSQAAFEAITGHGDFRKIELVGKISGKRYRSLVVKTARFLGGNFSALFSRARELRRARRLRASGRFWDSRVRSLL